MRQSLPDSVKPAAGYGVAAATVAVAALLNLLLGRWVESRATPLFLAAVAVTAWRGGKYPSLAATALAVFVIDYFFHPPLGAFELSVENSVNAAVFVTVALLISYIDTERKEALAERERLLTSEREARAEAENTNRTKDNFLAMVTHELRAPLNTILGWTLILRKEKLDPAQTARALTILERSVRTQARLIEDLLDITRVRMGKFHINRCPLELSGVIEASVEALAPEIEAKRIRLHRDLAENIGLVNGNAERLQQVICNLLSNSVKFTPAGGHVEIRLERTATHARIIVYDNGAGIRKEFLPFVFELFHQSEATGKAKHKGLGLGLTIVRHLVEAHGGNVSAMSAGEGLGATFTVELPLLAEPRETAKTAVNNAPNLEFI